MADFSSSVISIKQKLMNLPCNTGWQIYTVFTQLFARPIFRYPHLTAMFYIYKSSTLHICFMFKFTLSYRHPHYPQTFSLVPKVADDRGKIVHSLLLYVLCGKSYTYWCHVTASSTVLAPPSRNLKQYMKSNISLNNDIEIYSLYLKGLYHRSVFFSEIVLKIFFAIKC